MAELTLYSMQSSGNSYKVRLMLAHLGLRFRLDGGEYGSDALERVRAAGKMPLGRLPVLELPDGTLIAESNAILCYLAEGTAWMPEDPVARAQTLAWLFWEQNQHEGTIAVRGALRCYPHRSEQATPERLSALLDAGNIVLAQMESHLSRHDWLVGAHPTIADICLYAYTHTAGTRSGYDMAAFPAVNDWLARVSGLPGHVGLYA